jgi:hypothetical protein
MAEARREAEQAHPLRAEVPRDEFDDEQPMDVDEIRHEGPGTPMIEDDQGIDYDIDQYLDDPSKFIIF